MNLYKWNSSLLRRYSEGDIIVMAESVEEAMEKARHHFKTTFKEECDYLFYGYDGYEPEVELSGKLENDLAVEPEIVSCGVVFIEGSE